MSEFNDQKAHYESLVNLFKYFVTLLTALLTIIGVFISYTTYTNGKEMREDFKAKEKEMTDDLKARGEKMDKEIENLRTAAIKEVESVKIDARNKAEEAARNKINQVFDDKNLDQFVEKVAEERIVPTINAKIDEKMSAVETARIDAEIEGLSSTNGSRYLNAIDFFRANHSIQLSDKQSRRVMDFIDSNKDDESYVGALTSILLYMKSPAVLDYFKKRLDMNNLYSSKTQMAMGYFFRNGVEYDLFSEHLYSMMKDKPSNSGNRYMSTIEGCRSVGNKTFVIRLLNSKLLVDYVYQVNDNATPFSSYQDDMRKRIGNFLTESELNSSYFFGKK